MRETRYDYGERFAASWEVVTGAVGIYACPLCLTQFPLSKIDTLTWDHYPPQSIGGRGRDTVLVCEVCRERWSSTDADVSRLKEQEDYMHSYPGTVPAVLRFPNMPGLDRSSQQGAFSFQDQTLQLVARPEANPPQATKYISEQWAKIVSDQSGEPVTVRLTAKVPNYANSVRRAFIKAAYLAAFDCLGYPYILAPVMAQVQQQMLDPRTEHLPPPVAELTAQPSNADRQITIGYVDEPKLLRSIGVFFQGYALNKPVGVLLPVPAWPPSATHNYMEQLQRWPDKALTFDYCHIDRRDLSHITQRAVWVTDDSGRLCSLYDPGLH